MCRIFCLLFFALSVQFSSIVHAELTFDQLEAKAVVDRYFDALKQGDTQTIQSLLDGDLLTEQKALLNNPMYPGHLISMYQVATFEVITLETFDDGSIAVDTNVIIDNEESMHTRYLLHRAPRENTTANQLYIFAEISSE